MAGQDGRGRQCTEFDGALREVGSALGESGSLLAARVKGLLRVVEVVHQQRSAGLASEGR
jgi:hypothetical protein